MIDLHTHSTFSDGSLTPAQLVEQGLGAGLTAMALTDHDCVNGVGLFVEAARGTSMEAIPGVEISAEVPTGTLHMLGYFVDRQSAELEQVLAHIRGGRELRNRKILDKLVALGMELEWEDVRRHAGEEVVGRPHFAMALELKGYVSDKREAFDRYLGKGKPAYADRFRLSPEDSIEAIRRAGGLAVLAHPFTLELEPAALRRRVAELRDMGLSGLEVYYSEHSRKQQAQYARLARDLDLVATGGSDYHGAVNPDVRLGSGFGSLCVPDSVVAELRARLG